MKQLCLTAITDIVVSASVARQTGHKLNYVIIGALGIAVMYLVLIGDRADVDAQVSLQALIARPAVIVLPTGSKAASVPAQTESGFWPLYPVLGTIRSGQNAFNVLLDRLNCLK